MLKDCTEYVWSQTSKRWTYNGGQRQTMQEQSTGSTTSVQEVEEQPIRSLDSKRTQILQSYIAFQDDKVYCQRRKEQIL